MPASLYVPTDAHGVEHAAGGPIGWGVLGNAMSRHSTPGHPVLLRAPSALLDVLDERIYRAEPMGDAASPLDGVVSAAAARLTDLTRWDTESATGLALDCAAHALGEAGGLALPDGTTLTAVIDEARAALAGVIDDDGVHLGYLARLGALHRLRKNRSELGALATGLITDDLARHLDALDDPDYRALAPLVDAVLAAIEALRHHVVPRLVAAVEDAREEHEEHRVLDRASVMRVPTAEPTPWGTVEVGTGSLPFEPAWTSAREAARHARATVEGRAGAAAADQERSWQAEQLEAILAG